MTIEKTEELLKNYYHQNMEIKNTEAWWFRDCKKYQKTYLSYKKIKSERVNSYVKNKRNTNPLFKLSGILRNRIKHALKAGKLSKNNTTKNILGCDFETVKIHLENQFVDGMNWDNHGLFGWHIDHIIPLASANTEEELYKLCHYTNLQPL